MRPEVIPFALLCGLTLAGVAVSMAVLFYTKAMASDVGGTCEDRAGRQLAIDQVQLRLDLLTAELRELREQPITDTRYPALRTSLNLNTRSQALRLHRRGDSAGQIAAALDVPCQEVDLLIKVHGIVMSQV